MPESRRGPLITWSEGPVDAEPVLLLHDRYADHDQLDRFRAPLAGRHRVVRVRGARTQMEDTYIKGYYWFIGPPERPELSTFGDALHHLETLLLALAASAPAGKVALVGRGEGGTMALMLALVWPERVSRVVSIGGPLPANRAEFPLELRDGEGVRALLVPGAGPADGTAEALRAVGWQVETASDEGGAVDWLRAAA